MTDRRYSIQSAQLAARDEVISFLPSSHHPKPQCDRAYTHANGEAGADGGPAQLAANETPCEISATSQCSRGLPDWADPVLPTECS